MAITRRFFLAGLGSVSVGLLFRRKLDAVLESLERDLIDEPVEPNQAPSAAEIIVSPQVTFRPERLIVASTIANSFVLEDICIGGHSQFTPNNGIPAALFTIVAPDAYIHLSTAAAGTEIRFRVRYVGSDPAGARFQAALIGRVSDNYLGQRQLLPIDSGCAITA